MLVIAKILQILGLLITKTFFFLTVGQNNFGNKIPFLICSWRFLRSCNTFELNSNWKKIIRIQKPTGKVLKSWFLERICLLTYVCHICQLLCYFFFITKRWRNYCFLCTFFLLLVLFCQQMFAPLWQQLIYSAIPTKHVYCAMLMYLPT